nr:hypothetical protein BaRGS_008351 [Batillaria attramentaria]
MTVSNPALHDYQPSENDNQRMPAWLAVMEQAHLNLASLASQIKNSDASQTSVHKIIRALEAGLSYQFHATWDLVLQLLAVALECLSSMADLRETAHFSYKAEVDAAVGKAVRSMGPRLVLDAIPLKITGQEAWRVVLDALPEGVSNPPHFLRRICLASEADKQAVAQFTKNFLPILFNLFTKDPDNAHDNHRLAVLETVKVYITIADSEASDKSVQKKAYRILEEHKGCE